MVFATNKRLNAGGLPLLSALQMAAYTLCNFVAFVIVELESREEAIMLKKFRLPTMVLGAALALLPGATLARDHDWFERHERREREWREHEWREHRHHFRVHLHYGRRGYYDRWGYWHPYGYYDRWGYFHPYY